MRDQSAPAMTDEMVRFSHYLDVLVRRDPEDPTSLPTHPIELSQFAIRVHTAASSDRARPSFADDLLAQLVASQQETNSMTSYVGASSLPTTRPLPRPHAGLTKPDRSRIKWGWATILGLVTIAAVVIAILRPFERQPETNPVVVAPTADGTPVEETNVSEIWRYVSETRFLYPANPEFAPNGTLWIASPTENNFRIFSRDGELLGTFGEPGTGPGQFNMNRTPGDLEDSIAEADWDSDGNMYVADVGNRRIQKFDPDLNFVAEWPVLGANSGLPSQPYSLAVSADNLIFVMDTTNNAINVYDASGRLLRWFGESGSEPGQLHDLSSMAFDSRGYLWIPSGYTIARFNANGDFVFSFGEAGSDPGQMAGPFDVTVGPDGNLYVTETFGHRIQVFDPDGRFLTWFADPAGGPTGMPAGLAIDDDGYVYVSDFADGELVKLRVAVPDQPAPGTEALNAQGVNITSTSSKPGSPVAFNWSAKDPVTVGLPGSVTQAPDGTIWIADESTSTFHLFDANGTYLETWGEAGAGPGQFSFIVDVVKDQLIADANQVLFKEDGSFFVADPGNRRVQMFASDRSYLGEFGGNEPSESRIRQIGPMFAIGNGEYGVVDSTVAEGATFEMVIVDESGSFIRRGSYAGIAPVAFGTAGDYWSRVPLNSDWERGSSDLVTIAHFDADGTELARLDPENAHAKFVFVGPGGLDAAGNLYVGNDELTEVSIWRADGSLAGTFDGSGTDSGLIQFPRWIAVDSGGGILISDYIGKRVLKFTISTP